MVFESVIVSSNLAAFFCDEKTKLKNKQTNKETKQNKKQNKKQKTKKKPQSYRDYASVVTIQQLTSLIHCVSLKKAQSTSLGIFGSTVYNTGDNLSYEDTVYSR